MKGIFKLQEPVVLFLIASNDTIYNIGTIKETFMDSKQSVGSGRHASH